MENTQVTVGLVDDHPFVAKGLGVLMERDGGLALRWAACDVIEAISKLASHPVELLIIDMKLGNGSSGFAMLDRINMTAQPPAAVVFSAYATPRLVREAARRGARGYFCKSECGARMIEALRMLADGGSDAFFGDFQGWTKPNPLLELSAREREVLMELARGKSNQAVAVELGLKVGTVKTHLESIYSKLGVNNRTEALRVALAEGYFNLEDIA